MKVKCLCNTGEGLFVTTKKYSGDTDETKYPLKVNEVYTVYGQGILNGILYYLIIGTYEDLPSWYPAELFLVIDKIINVDWYYRFNSSHIATALWGYYELIYDDMHYENLIMRDHKAVSVFLKRKVEMDTY